MPNIKIRFDTLTCNELSMTCCDGIFRRNGKFKNGRPVFINEYMYRGTWYGRNNVMKKELYVTDDGRWRYVSKKNSDVVETMASDSQRCCPLGIYMQGLKESLIKVQVSRCQSHSESVVSPISWYRPMHPLF